LQDVVCRGDTYFRKKDNAKAQRVVNILLRKLVMMLGKSFIEMYFWDTSVKMILELNKNQPGYLTIYGSTVRMDWKEKNPEQYALYFKCTSSLVQTFKTVYKDKFKFKGKEVIVLVKPFWV